MGTSPQVSLAFCYEMTKIPQSLGPVSSIQHTAKQTRTDPHHHALLTQDTCEENWFSGNVLCPWWWDWHMCVRRMKTRQLWCSEYDRPSGILHAPQWIFCHSVYWRLRERGQRIDRFCFFVRGCSSGEGETAGMLRSAVNMSFEQDLKRCAQFL